MYMFQRVNVLAYHAKNSDRASKSLPPHTNIIHSIFIFHLHPTNVLTLMRLPLFKPTSFTCLALTTLARSVHGFSSPPLSLKASAVCAQRSTFSSLVCSLSTSFDRHTLIPSRNSFQLRMSSSADSTSSNRGLYLFDFDGGEYTCLFAHLVCMTPACMFFN